MHVEASHEHYNKWFYTNIAGKINKKVFHKKEYDLKKKQWHTKVLKVASFTVLPLRVTGLPNTLFYFVLCAIRAHLKTRSYRQTLS